MNSTQLLINTEIYLRRRQKIVLPAGENEGQLDASLTGALLKNLESLGYTLSGAALAQVQTLSVEQLKAWYPPFWDAVKKSVGAHVTFRPFYPNFPQQVMEMSEARLYVNALVHYLTNRLPVFAKTPRPELDEKTPLRVIELGDEADFRSILTDLVKAKGSLSVSDRDDVTWFIAALRDDAMPLLPDEIAARETLAFVGSRLIQNALPGSNEWIKARVSTATDVLRLAVALCGGDISLAAPTKFKFTRSVRRSLLSLLEGITNPVEDMNRWRGRWLRLGEALHPGEWKEKFPLAYTAFQSVRNNKAVPSFNAHVEAALEAGRTAKAISLLSQRPGDFARRLDALMRHAGAESGSVLESFEEVAARVSTPVLLQMHAHFKHRVNPTPLRVFFPKGQVAKAWGHEGTLPAMDESVRARTVEMLEGELKSRFGKLEPLGACYLDERLDFYTVPFANRSAAKSLRTIGRGSRVALPESNVVRFFLWWKNGKFRTDLDLSAAIFDENFVYKDVISYYNLKNYGGAHSGDIVDAPNGAAEFIDIDIKKTIEAGARYVVMSVNSYTSQPFCDLPECFAGHMARKKANSGEIFEPRTISDRFDLSADTQICLPLAVDLQTREMVWMDLALRRHPSWNNVQNNLSGVSLLARAMLNLEKPVLGELFRLHIEARGHLVQKKEEAQTVFSVEEGVTPFDGERIGANWL
ncbi:hypothetical protein IAD21_04176 [Abditibacteriota bacterium]|nr:hypothetical protein IAD21_04176 [Abditibacteriota bacterium]